jgi:putative flippase GtrA
MENENLYRERLAMGGGKLTCARCKNSFLSLSSGAEMCPHCGAEVAGGTAPPSGEVDGWYYTRGGAQAGPASAAELKRMAETGQLLPTDFVRKGNSTRWIEAGTVRGLFPEVPAHPQPEQLPRPEPEQRAPFDSPHPAPVGPRRPRPRARSYELLVGLTAVAVLTGTYVLLSRSGAPGASSTIGYALGITGFLLMLATETLYSLRKRVRNFHRGRMSTWLKVHIVTGLVGPCLVLLHSGGTFHGLAGVLAALTVVIVASGFIGRYIYTAVPRTIDGAEVAVRELEEQIAEADRELQAEGSALADVTALALDGPRRGWVLVLGRGVWRWSHRRRLRRALRPLRAAGVRTGRLERLLMRRYEVQVQIASLALARRLLALWHVLHIPLGAAVFTLAFIHIAAALYYTAFLR